MSQVEDHPHTKTLSDHLKALAGALLIVLFTFALIELLLATVDPWGMSYFSDLDKMGNDIFQSDLARGYVMPDGDYSFSHWSAHIKDGGRVIPSQITSPSATCQIAILGDSVAFGYGVSDDAVWLNAIAAALPQVHFVNYAIPRYNSTNVLMTLKAYPDYDAYLYIVVDNDVQPAINVDTQKFTGGGTHLPWLIRYMNFAIFRGGGSVRSDAPADFNSLLPSTPDTQRFFTEIAEIAADSHVTTVAFEGESYTNSLIAQGFDVYAVPYPPYRISFSDYHLNEVGNQQLAQSLQPIISQMVKTHCG